MVYLRARYQVVVLVSRREVDRVELLLAQSVAPLVLLALSLALGGSHVVSAVDDVAVFASHARLSLVVYKDLLQVHL